MEPALTAAGLLRPDEGSIFLLGEVHGVAENYALDFAFLRYFHDQAGVRVYLSEVSHAHALLLNRYLVSGDESILDFTLGELKGFVDGSEERRKFYRDLRQWNSHLDPTDRVVILGLDLERMPRLSLAYLEQLVSNRVVPHELQQVAANLHRILMLPVDQVREGLEKTGRDIASRPALYNQWLGGSDAFSFSLIIANVLDRYYCLADPALFDRRRDEIMLRNFTRQAARLNIVRAYGRMGSAHILQRPTGNIDHFSSLLNQPGTAYAGKVVGIWPLYFESRRLAYANGQYGSAACIDDQAALAPFTAATNADLTLYQLNAPDSPFSSSHSLPGEAASGATTDYFQYTVLIKHGHPAIPMRR